MKKIAIIISLIMLMTACTTQPVEDDFDCKLDGYKKGYDDGYTDAVVESDAAVREMIEKGQLLLPNAE